jgi:hypothetical protein
MYPGRDVRLIHSSVRAACRMDDSYHDATCPSYRIRRDVCIARHRRDFASARHYPIVRAIRGLVTSYRIGHVRGGVASVAIFPSVCVCFFQPQCFL